MVNFFGDSAESTDILAKVLIAGVAGVTGCPANISGKVASVFELAQFLGCTDLATLSSTFPASEVTYIYDSRFYSSEDVKLMVAATAKPLC